MRRVHRRRACDRCPARSILRSDSRARLALQAHAPQTLARLPRGLIAARRRTHGPQFVLTGRLFWSLLLVVFTGRFLSSTDHQPTIDSSTLTWTGPTHSPRSPARGSAPPASLAASTRRAAAAAARRAVHR